MDELKQWLQDHPCPKNGKGFQSIEIPPHLLPIIERVIGNNRQEHPDNALLIDLLKAWAEGSRE
ncbi:hypothetical protein [Spirosoma sp.]|uniref:hypothetical protein n=1 Tax=Spirosoma sp. TaxID=1899569 RepID=UPI003B3B04E3